MTSNEAGAELPPPVPGKRFTLETATSGRLAVYERLPDQHSESRPLLLIHSVNAAASAYEVLPLYEHYGASRPTYALDLPGYGLSDRGDRVYTPRMMTDAISAVTDEIRRRHGGRSVDALAVSLGSEFLARAANEAPTAYRSVAFVSPTGVDGKRRTGPAGSTRGRPVLRAIVGWGGWDSGVFRLLTRPSVIRYFLERTWGARNIDEGLWAYDVQTTRQPGARHAPLYFLSGHLFSADVTRLYERLEVPVWVAHGVRGDFVRYDGLEPFVARRGWRREIFDTGALVHFELPQELFAAYDRFLASAAAAPGR